MNVPNIALASIASALVLQETSVRAKEPVGRQVVYKGDLYIAEPGKEPGTVELRIERNQDKYREAVSVFQNTDFLVSNAQKQKDACLKAAEHARKLKNPGHEEQHRKSAEAADVQLKAAMERFEAAALDCPQAYYDVLTGRAQRQADIAGDCEGRSVAKLRDAEDMEDRGRLSHKQEHDEAVGQSKPYTGPVDWDDKMLAIAQGARALSEELSQRAKEARKKEAEILALRPDCNGAQDYVERFTVRLVVEVIGGDPVSVPVTIEPTYQELCALARSLGFTGTFLKKPKLVAWIAENQGATV